MSEPDPKKDETTELQWGDAEDESLSDILSIDSSQPDTLDYG